MKIPNKKQTKRIWKSVTKSRGIKTICLSRWFHRRKKKWFLKQLFTEITDRLDERLMFLHYRGRDYIHVPKGFWKGLNNVSYRAWALSVLAHELEHWEQCRKTKGYYTKYILDDKKRAYWELRGVIAQADIEQAFNYDVNHLFGKRWQKTYRVKASLATEVRKAYISANKRRHQTRQCESIAGGIVVAAIRKELD